MSAPAREGSRHRRPSRFALPPAARRVLGSAAPALSLVPPLVLVVLVQSLSPDAQRVPTGAGRFDLAAAWLSVRPGALAGVDAWTGAPVLGRVQLGLLLQALGGAAGGSVLGAAHAAMLLLAVLQTGLVWWLLRRTGAAGLGAGLAAAVLAISPIAVQAHAAVSATAIGTCWALAAGALAAGKRGRVAVAGAGVAAVLAVASAPVLLPVLAAGAVLLAVRTRSGRAAGRRPPALAAGALPTALVLAAAALALGAAAPDAAGRALAAVDAAQGRAPAFGAAALRAWWATDPLLVVAAAVAVGITAVVVRDVLRVVPLLVAAALAVWPLGDDAVTPLVVLLPALALPLAAAVDRGAVALGSPRFVRSVAGSGWLAGVGAVLVVGLVVWVTGLGSLVRGADQPISRVEQWLARGVPAGQTVLVGLGAWPDLAAGSRADVGWYAGASATMASSLPWSAADYVVADASLPATRTGAAATALERSLEVARYGTGGGAMEVRAVRAPAPPTPTVTPPATAEERAALATRKQAGRQLAENPALEIAGDGRAQLLAGEVDMRVAVVLAQFMTTHRISVVTFGDADSSGVLHGVTIAEVDGERVPGDAAATGALLRFLSELAGDVAAGSIDAGDDGVTATFG